MLPPFYGFCEGILSCVCHDLFVQREGLATQPLNFGLVRVLDAAKRRWRCNDGRRIWA